jgi:prepilin-type processing-associated H-X9-DG protein
MTDWSGDSTDPYLWDLGKNGGKYEYIGYKASRIKRSVDKIMFVDAGDLWTEMKGANYKTHWDVYGDDIEEYRRQASASISPSPPMFRHNKSINVAYYDGHVEKKVKSEVFYYDSSNPDVPDIHLNDRVWFVDRSRSANAN